jgi:ribonuclease-3
MDQNRVLQLDAFQKQLGFEFGDIGILNTALTHTSYVKGEGKGSDHNERLEFLGDAVLEVCVSEYLYKRYPDMNEGQMTKARALSVNETALCEVAQEIGIGDLLLLSFGEEHTGGREKASILSDALEALIGAVFIDAGMSAAKDFILGFAIKTIEKAVSGTIVKDYKTMLQEYVQSDHKGSIKYSIKEIKGPDHKKVFTMQAELNGQVIGVGTGNSKQEASQSAAQMALQKYKQIE